MLSQGCVGVTLILSLFNSLIALCPFHPISVTPVANAVMSVRVEAGVCIDASGQSNVASPVLRLYNDA
jgi:hypothetical protein